MRIYGPGNGSNQGEIEPAIHVYFSKDLALVAGGDAGCEELRCLACYHVCHYSKVGHKPTPQALELGSVFSHLTFYYKQSNFYHTNKK